MVESGTQADRRRLDTLIVDGAVVVPPRLAGWVRSLIAGALIDLRRRGRGSRIADDVLGLLDALSLTAASDNGSQEIPGETMEVDQILTCAQAAQALECSERAVRAALQEGRLRGLKSGPRHWAILASDLDDYRHHQHTKGTPRGEEGRPGHTNGRGPCDGGDRAGAERA